MISGYIDCAAVDSAINTALDYLDQLGDVSPPVARCRRYFKSLRALWEKRRSPLNNGVLHDMQGQGNTEETSENTGLSPIGEDLGQVFGDFLYDSSQNLFLEPLLPDFLLDV